MEPWAVCLFIFIYSFMHSFNKYLFSMSHRTGAGGGGSSMGEVPTVHKRRAFLNRRRNKYNKISGWTMIRAWRSGSGCDRAGERS